MTVSSRLRTLLRLTAWSLLAVAARGQSGQPQLSAMLAQFGVTPQQQAAIDKGRPVARVLSWGAPSEVYVFGAVYIEGSPAAYLKAARDVSRLAGTPGYLGAGELPASATGADLVSLTLEPDDVKALKSCREGECDVQLPTASMQAFRHAVNWTRPDAASQADALARGMVLDLIREYRRGGNVALGVYRDKEHPTQVADQFETMVGRSATLSNLLPEVRRYLLEYPEADLPGADSFYFWEKVDFGMKPTIRVNHAVLYRTGEPGRDTSVVAIKQLYASHYFHTALDVSICVTDAARPDRRGFYLLTLKSSEQDGLTGVKGSMLRRIVVDKTRSSLERGLALVKQSVEQASAAPR